MSADRYSVCPWCAERLEIQREAANRAAAEAYRRLPPDEWRELARAANALPSEPEETLRENWEFGDIEGGELEITYSASCTAEGCGFELIHEAKVPVPPLPQGGQAAKAG